MEQKAPEITTFFCLRSEAQIGSDSGALYCPHYCHVEHLGIYELTEYGKRELEDYLAAKKTDRKELWLKNAWIPIIVSLVTSAIANYILPKLPQILRWAANTLSKIVS